MNCEKCGSDIPEDAAFCHRCGAEVPPRGSREVDESPSTEPTSSEADGPSALADQLKPGNSPRRDDPEVDLWEGGYSPRAMIGSWVVAGVTSIAGFILAIMVGYWGIIFGALALMWIVLGLQLAYRRLSVGYRLTTQRFFHYRGMLNRVTDRIEVIDMDDITCTQGPIQRIFGIGSICVTSSDRTHPELVLIGIEDVQNVAGMIDQARRNERVRRGLHIEAI